MKDLLELFETTPLLRVDCPACDSPGGTVAVVRNGFSFVLCANCSSFFVNPRPAEKSLSEMYEAFPELAAGRAIVTVSDSLREHREAVYRLRCLFEVASSGRLLDVGCGTGEFLRIAGGHFDVTGIDIAPRVALQNERIPTVKGNARTLPFGTAKFEIVTAFEVLEHLAETQNFLDEVHRVLDDRGVFIVQTGDADTLLARINPQRWRYLMPPVHLNAFSRKALYAQLRKTGFEFLKAWSFGQAPSRTPLVSRLSNPEALRPVFDYAARVGFLGQMYAFRRASYKSKALETPQSRYRVRTSRPRVEGRGIHRGTRAE